MVIDEYKSTNLIKQIYPIFSMKILFVSEYFPPKIMGGGEINLHLLVKALAKNKNEVSVLTSHHPGLKIFEETDGIKVYRTLKTGDTPNGIINNFRRSWSFPKSIAKEAQALLKKQQFDLIHFIGTSIIAAPKIKSFCRKRKISLFATIESYPALCPKGDRIYCGKKECRYQCTGLRFLHCQSQSPEIGKMKNKFYLRYNLPLLLYIYNYHRLLNRALKHCTLIAISRYMQELLLKNNCYSHIIPNALNIKAFSSPAAENKTGKPIKVIYLGALIKSKGPQILLEAVKGLDCRCELYGEGILKESLQKFIQKNKLNAVINNLVPYDKIPQVYASSDIVVFPSLWPEPFGRISIEAMAASKPVIGSEIGGIRETIEPGTGILVKPGSVEELHLALKQLLESRSNREKIGRCGLDAVQKYQEKKIIARLIKLYRLQVNQQREEQTQ